MTLDEVKGLKHGDVLHENGCKIIVGPRGGETFKPDTWRVTGKVKTWKRDPNRIEVPLAFGLYQHSRVTERNLHLLHLAKDCKLDRVLVKMP